MAKDIVYSVGIDDSDVLKKLKAMESAIDRIAGEGSRDFDKLGDAAKKAGDKAKGSAGGYKAVFSQIKTGAGVAVAAVAGIGAAFVGAFEVAKSAIEGVRLEQALFNLAKGVGTSGDEILAAMKKASAGTISDMELMRQANLALQLGVAKTPEEFEKLTRSALVLGRSVGRGPTEALYDLINAAGRRSTEVLDNLGISLAKVNARMEAMAQQEFGQSAESLSTAAANALFMRAAIEQAAEQADRLGTSMDDVGSRVEQVGAKFGNLKQDASEGFLIVADRAIVAAEGIFNAFFGSDGVFPLFNEQGKIIQQIFAAIAAAGLATAATIAEQINRIRKVATGEIGIGELPSAGTAVNDFSENFAQAMGKIVTDFEQIFNPAAGAAGVEPFFDGAADATAEGVDKMGKELEKLGEKKEDALRDFGQGIQDAQIDLARDLEKIDVESERKRTDILLDAARDREKAARDHAQELADIRLKNAQEIDDAELDLGRDAAKLAREQARDRLEIEQDARDQRVDLEKSFRERLQDITREADLDLEEAERSRDAVAFLRILRKKNEDINAAQQDRQRSIDDLKVETQRRKEELQLRQQAERQELAIGHQQKLEDLQISLEREIEAQNTAHARELENINISEQQKLDDLATWRERERADAQTAFDQKLQDLELNLQRELALIQAHYAELEKEAAKHAQNMANAEAAAAPGPSNRASSPRSGSGRIDSPGFASGGSIGADSPGFTSGGSIGQGRTTRRPPLTRGRQHGGPVTAGESFLVGEGGPELFQPGTAGKIVPNQALVMPNFGSQSAINNIDSSRHNAPVYNFPVGDASLFNDPIFAAKLRNVLLSTLNEVL